MNPQDLVHSVESYLANINPATIAWNVALSVIVVIGLRLLQRPVQRLVDQRVTDPNERYRWRRVIGYTLRSITVILIAAIWLNGISNLATILAILAAGLAIALRDPIVDLGGWLYILWRKPFEVGHRVSIGSTRGDVIDIGIFVFSLMEVGDGVSTPRQSTGRVIQVPNMYIFTESLLNENIAFDFIWNEVPVVVTFESDWQRAKQILSEIVQRHGSHLAPLAEEQMRRAEDRFLVKSASFAPAVYTRVVDHGVELSMRFLSEVRRPRIMEQAIWEDVLGAFAREPAIDFAYPTTRFYRNPEEGKAGTGGPAST